jgi:hydroxymethylpyrimidine pyrophosphatase-like HAD family hydrolase
MPGDYFRAVAVDYDGTITADRRPDDAVLRAIAAARAAGWRMVLVTGRILAELRDVFPEVEAAFDAVVAENGGVVWTPGRGTRSVARPVCAELETALGYLGVPVRRGRVLLATTANHDQAILREIARLGLECQLIHNRSALMVLPAGITKGTGLLEVLSELGISRHNTIGVGDAENDHSLFDVCELGVAVGNALEGLKVRADLVLPAPDGQGFTEFLLGRVMPGGLRVSSPRQQVRLGSYPDGRPATIPSAQANLLVIGGTRSGKSCLANLLAERLIARGYSICVLDPEGDHMEVGRFPGVVALGGNGDLPHGELLRPLLQQGHASVVIDLSLRPESEKRDYFKRILKELQQIREDTGLPHWLVVDEAHLVQASEPPCSRPGDSMRGLCLVTYRPSDLGRPLREAMDIIIRMPGADSLASLDLAPDHPLAAHLTREALEQFDSLAAGSALIVDRDGIRVFTVDRLVRGHVRHWHKYLHANLPPHHQFYFRTSSQATGILAANLVEFHDAVLRIEGDSLRHHAINGDFSRWISEVIRDQDLAAEVRKMEREYVRHGDLATLRRTMVDRLEQWFPEENPAPATSNP